jgi:hypothetical protein
MRLTDMTDSIAGALGDYGDDYDIDALTGELLERYGLVHVDSIPTAEFWEIADRHQLPPVPDEPSDEARFDTEITAAITAERPLGTPAVWQRGGITVHITGASRVNPALRLQGADVTITSTWGRTLAPRGLATTGDLWRHVAPALAEWEQAVHAATEAADQARRAAGQARAAAEKAEREEVAAETALRALLPDAAPSGTMSRDEVADYLGIAPASVPKYMSRWDVATTYEPGPSGRPKARYDAAQVTAKAAARPGRGVGGGRPPRA